MVAYSPDSLSQAEKDLKPEALGDVYTPSSAENGLRNDTRKEQVPRTWGYSYS